MKYYFYLWAILIVIWTGCKKSTPLETDPAKIILGKWTISSMASNYVPNPDEFIQFLPDSIVNEGNPNTGYMVTQKYWIDSLLHTKREVGTEQMILEYKYEFSADNNELVIEYTNFYALYNIFKLKRIK